MPHIEQIHVVRNPHASWVNNSRKRELMQAKLQDVRDSVFGSRLAKPDDFINTSANLREMAERLDEKVQEGDSLIEIGGDGTVHLVTNAILKHSRSPHVKDAPRLRLDAGYANDGTLQLNNTRQLMQPSKILAAGKIATYHPMAWSFRGLGTPEDTVYAEFYGTVGGSANGALRLNESQNHDADSKLRKAWAVLQALRETQPFKVQVDNETEPRTLFEMGFGNGTRMAQFTHCFPYDLTDPRVFHYEVANREMIRSALRFQFGKVPGEPLATPYGFLLSHATPVQMEGEAFITAPNTHITVEHSREQINAYSLLLGKPA